MLRKIAFGPLGALVSKSVRRSNRPSQSCSTCKTTNGPSLSVRPRRDTRNPRSFSNIGGIRENVYVRCGNSGRARPADALGVKQELEKALAQDGKPTT
jgi:hypothetical protein